MVLKTLTKVFLLCGNVIQFDSLCAKLLELLKYNLKIHSSIIIVLRIIKRMIVSYQHL